MKINFMPKTLYYPSVPFENATESDIEVLPDCTSPHPNSM